MSHFFSFIIFKNETPRRDNNLLHMLLLLCLLIPHLMAATIGMSKALRSESNIMQKPAVHQPSASYSIVRTTLTRRADTGRTVSWAWPVGVRHKDKRRGTCVFAEMSADGTRSVEFQYSNDWPTAPNNGKSNKNHRIHKPKHQMSSGSGGNNSFSADRWFNRYIDHVGSVRSLWRSHSQRGGKKRKIFSSIKLQRANCNSGQPLEWT